MDPSIRPFFILLLAPLFIGLGLYLALGRRLPGQTQTLHIQLGVGAVVMGALTALAGIFAP